MHLTCLIFLYVYVIMICDKHDHIWFVDIFYTAHVHSVTRLHLVCVFNRKTPKQNQILLDVHAVMMLHDTAWPHLVCLDMM